MSENQTAAPHATDPQPTMWVYVDARNPGQFFACCGLLELAYRAWGCRALGWFEGKRFALHIPDYSRQAVDDRLMKILREMTFTAADPLDSGSPIIINMGDCGTLRADWWLKTVYRASLRTWGRGTSLDLLTSLCEEGRQAENIVFGLDLTAKLTGRLSVDPRSSWTALDAGFSPNDQSFTVATFPLVEFLAGIGLQRNRPVLENQHWRYTVWNSPLPSPLISTAAHTLPPTQLVSYRFELAQRGQMTRYFTYSIEGAK